MHCIIYSFLFIRYFFSCSFFFNRMLELILLILFHLAMKCPYILQIYRQLRPKQHTYIHTRQTFSSHHIRVHAQRTHSFEHTNNQHPFIESKYKTHVQHLRYNMRTNTNSNILAQFQMNSNNNSI